MQTASLPWFARHEARLVWRDWLSMLRAGRDSRWKSIAIGMAVFVALLHGLGYAVLKPYALGWQGDKAALFALTGSAFLSWTLMLSQALESATRAFHARADLDLILSSPANARSIFAIRIGSIALALTAMAFVLFGPFINIMALLAGPGFLAAYGVLVAMSATAAGLATVLTVALFRLFGPRRTRLLAQIAAAIIGAGFVIGVQAIAILSYGSLSRSLVFQSAEWVAATPDLDSLFWWPALAASGDTAKLLILLACALLFLLGTIGWAADRFARQALSVASISRGNAAVGNPRKTFRPRSSAAALRRKEWLLLARDPWLVSQSLMQLLYLLPPALLLWRDFGTDAGHLVVITPVLVMAAGQLAGGLAWLAISGEDAPDLVATAPVSAFGVMRAKVEAVMIAAAAPIAPLALVLAFVSPWAAAVTLGFSLSAAAAATAIQIAFRAQAKRSHFRRRQTSSRFATFAEAFSSIAIAGAAGAAAAGSWFALGPLGFAGVVVLAAHRFGLRRGG